MASILRVNTLTDASSNNSVPMATVNQGTAKAWMNLKGTDTFGLRDSFNTGSATDNGTGDYTQTYTAGFADGNYSVSLINQGTDADDNGNFACVRTPATSSVRIGSRTARTSGAADTPYSWTQEFGDLA
jgi:hypothetical protein|tara:strand:- start:180 stop:566 length:387 start_codon:yes stop_codon:yes gene_type:complete